MKQRESGTFVHFHHRYTSGTDRLFRRRTYKTSGRRKSLGSIITPGSAVYLGSYQVTGIERNFLKSDTFEIKRSKEPDKSIILEHLKQAAKGTGWDKRFANVLHDNK